MSQNSSIFIYENHKFHLNYFLKFSRMYTRITITSKIYKFKNYLKTSRLLNEMCCNCFASPNEHLGPFFTNTIRSSRIIAPMTKLKIEIWRFYMKNTGTTKTYQTRKELVSCRVRFAYRLLFRTRWRRTLLSAFLRLWSRHQSQRCRKIRQSWDTSVPAGCNWLLLTWYDWKGENGSAVTFFCCVQFPWTYVWLEGHYFREMKFW